MAERAVLELSLRDARRLAVRAQLLDSPRPTDLMATVRRLTLLQVDQTAAVAPHADLALWTRLGSSYDPADLRAAVDDQSLVELHGMLRPAEDVVLYRADMAAWPGPEARDRALELEDWVRDNDACRRDVLERLRADGPLPLRELPDTCVRPWRSSGWNNGKNLDRLLVLLAERGEVAVSGREGRERLWDLAERVYPDDPVVPADDAARIRDERRLASLGIARARSAKVPGEVVHVGGAGVTAVVDGLRGSWQVDPTLLDGPFTGRAALLSPLDRLVFDRRRMSELFDFDYQLEMYKPAAERRWGYWALPVLHGDRLVGKLDTTADRDAGELVVHALHEDEPFPPAVADAVRAEIEELGRWLGLEVVRE